MEPSDWIAIVALVVAAGSIFFNHLTNRENIKARRAEIVVEKSMEAYREIAEKIQAIRPATTGKVLTENSQLAFDAIEDCVNTIQKYRFFLPKEISRELRHKTSTIDLLIREKAVFHNASGLASQIEEIEPLIESMQKHLGIETEAKSTVS
jgi:hypothetical protein